MNEIFYVDLYFFTNFLMDLVSLAVGALSASRKVTLARLSLSAAVGGAFSTVLAFLSLQPLLSLALSMVAFALMIGICFGFYPVSKWGKPALFSFAGAVFLGGAAEVFSYYLLPRGSAARLGFAVLLGSVLVGFGMYSLWGKHLRRKLETAVVSLSISFCGRCEHYFGLVDSGLLLRDPDEGRPVLLLKAEYAAPLLPQEFIRRMELGETEGEEKLVSVPVRSVGGRSELFAFLPERVQVVSAGNRQKKRREGEVLVALDFSGGGYGGCPCLVPLAVL